MRKNAIVILLVVALLTGIFYFFFMDRLVEKGLEKSGELLFGAKVEIDNLKVHFSPLGIEWDRLQAANKNDTGRNLFETAKIDFSIRTGPLLEKKIVIDEMKIAGIRLNTVRKTDGKLPEDKKQKDSGPGFIDRYVGRVKDEIRSTPIFSLNALKKAINIDSLIDTRNFASFQLADSIKSNAGGLYNNWDSSLRGLEEKKQKIDAILAVSRSVDVKNLKSVDEIKKNLDKLNEARKEVQDFSLEVNGESNKIENSYNQFRQSIRQVDDVAKDDYQNVLKKAKLPDANMKGIGKVIVGGAAMDKMGKYLGWFYKIRDAIPRSKVPKEPMPERGKGQNIRFPKENTWPDFLVKQIYLSGQTDSLKNLEGWSGSGTISNVTSQQKIWGKPLMVDLKGQQVPNASFELSGIIDRRTEVNKDTYQLSVRGISLGDFPLGKGDFVPSTIQGARSDMMATVGLVDDRVNGLLQMKIREMKIRFDSPEKPTSVIESITREVLSGIDGFQLQIKIWGSGETLKMDLDTDLDNLIAARTKKVVGDALAKVQNKIRSEVEKRVNEKKKEVTALLDQKKQEATIRMKKIQGDVNEYIQVIDKKKKEAEEAIKKQGTGVLKGIFDKVK